MSRSCCFSKEGKYSKFHLIDLPRLSTVALPRSDLYGRLQFDEPQASNSD